jgi:hypothetical protein
MLGYAVESVDFNLPVDSFTRKPLFAFSCNRAIRESYDGPLFENEDGDDVGISELVSNVGKKIVKIYDQKVRHGHSLHNATVVGNVTLEGETGYSPDSSHQLPTVPNSGNDYVFPAGERPLIVSLKTDSAKRIVEGEIYRLRRFRVSNTNARIENLEGTDVRYIGVRGGDWEIVSTVGPHYYLSFNGSSYFTLPIAQYLTKDAGVYAVCDPTGTGRAPVFSAISSTHELSFDLGSAYMRFSYYPDSEKQLLFGGIDSPDTRKDGYAGNYADNIILQSVKGSTGESKRRYDIASLDTAYIGRDKDYYYEGKIYELVITDFEIPRDSINQVFSDWGDYYALT